ncbi:MAG: hypothetical protein CMO55_14830 [Verrucomicrobiales bacterium]|nr:hypothetical protein [Verrucomicrobiales bacterium]
MGESCNVASAEFLERLRKIEPSFDRSGRRRHYPCKVTLKDGRVVPRVICVEDHRGFQTDAWIHPDQVRSIEPTAERLPAELASDVYAAGESGMGYEIFVINMLDGSQPVFVTNNIVDFPDYPGDLDASAAVSVMPHHGRERPRGAFRGSREFEWCYFVAPEKVGAVGNATSGSRNELTNSSQSCQNSPSMETILAMKERHRVERLNAKRPPIGIFLMILIPLVCGSVLTYFIGFFWGVFYWIIGGMLFSYNSYVVHKRLDAIADRQKAEIDSRENTVRVTEVVD